MNRKVGNAIWYSLVSVTVGLSGSGCTSKSEAIPFSTAETPPPNESAIYFYRNTKEGSGLEQRTIEVLIDGKQVGTMPAGGYFERDVNPGNHTIKVETSIYLPALMGGLVEYEQQKPRQINIETPAGTISYVRLHATDMSLYIGSEATAVPESEAIAEMKGTNLAE